jgi:hypothetical protein
MSIIAREMYKKMREPTWEDVELEKANKDMQRKLMRRKLDAFAAGEAELEKQRGLAENPNLMFLNGRPMEDPQGHRVIAPDSVAAQNLMKDPYAQLQLLQQGQTAAVVPQLAGRIMEGSEARDNAMAERVAMELMKRRRMQQQLGMEV